MSGLLNEYATRTDSTGADSQQSSDTREISLIAVLLQFGPKRSDGEWRRRAGRMRVFARWRCRKATDINEIYYESVTMFGKTVEQYAV